MIAVIFEVIPHAETKQQYLDIAANLKSTLVEMDGFISVERFQSLSDSNKILSLSFWRDEAAVAHWRNTEMHRAAQGKGREQVFADYRIRIGSIVRDYGMQARNEAPVDSQQRHG